MHLTRPILNGRTGSAKMNMGNGTGQARPLRTVLAGSVGATLVVARAGHAYPWTAGRDKPVPYGRSSQNDLTQSSSISMCSVLTSSSDTSMLNRNKNATSVSCSRTVT